MKPRYTIATITTPDLDIVEKSKLVRASGSRHNDIYERGLNEIIKEKNLDKD